MLKKIPYLEIIINTITHPLRFYTGVIAAGSFNFHGIAFLIGLFALGVAVLKRKKELMEDQKEARAVLRYYTNNSLRNILLVIGLLFIIKLFISKNLDFYFGVALFSLYLILMVGYHKTKFIQELMNRWY